jgi:hypothetical protein
VAIELDKARTYVLGLIEQVTVVKRARLFG